MPHIRLDQLPQPVDVVVKLVVVRFGTIFFVPDPLDDFPFGKPAFGIGRIAMVGVRQRFQDAACAIRSRYQYACGKFRRCRSIRA